VTLEIAQISSFPASTFALRIAMMTQTKQAAKSCTRSNGSDAMFAQSTSQIGLVCAMNPSRGANPLGLDRHRGATEQPCQQHVVRHCEPLTFVTPVANKK